MLDLEIVVVEIEGVAIAVITILVEAKAIIPTLRKGLWRGNCFSSTR